jgi:hypothetical protein
MADCAKRPPGEALVDLRRRLALLSPRDPTRTKVIARVAAAYAVSVWTIYRALRQLTQPKSVRRSDHGSIRAMPADGMERYAEIIAALEIRTSNKKGRHLSTARAIRLLDRCVYGEDAEWALRFLFNAIALAIRLRSSGRRSRPRGAQARAGAAVPGHSGDDLHGQRPGQPVEGVPVGDGQPRRARAHPHAAVAGRAPHAGAVEGEEPVLRLDPRVERPFRTCATRVPAASAPTFAARALKYTSARRGFS